MSIKIPQDTGYLHQNHEVIAYDAVFLKTWIWQNMQAKHGLLTRMFGFRLAQPVKNSPAISCDKFDLSLTYHA